MTLSYHTYIALEALYSVIIQEKEIKNGKKETNMYWLFFFYTMTVYLENKTSVWILYIKKKG